MCVVIRVAQCWLCCYGPAVALLWQLFFFFFWERNSHCPLRETRSVQGQVKVKLLAVWPQRIFCFTTVWEVYSGLCSHFTRLEWVSLLWEELSQAGNVLQEDKGKVSTTDGQYLTQRAVKKWTDARKRKAKRQSLLTRKLGRGRFYQILRQVFIRHELNSVHRTVSPSGYTRAKIDLQFTPGKFCTSNK